MAEYWDLYDSKGNKLEDRVLSGQELANGLFHISVNVWIVNANNEILIQRRYDKSLNSDKFWFSAVGGDVLSGETSFHAVVKNAREKLGIYIDFNQAKNIDKIINSGDNIVDIWLVRQNVDLDLIEFKDDDAKEVRWATIKEIRDLISLGKFSELDALEFNKIAENMKTREHYGIYGLITDGNKILLIKKRRGPYTGLYDLPGGSQKDNELDIQTLVREIREETGCDVISHELITKFQVDFTCFFEDNGERGCLAHTGLLYRCEVVGEPDSEIVSSDSEGAFWVNKKELNDDNASPIVILALGVKDARYDTFKI